MPEEFEILIKLGMKRTPQRVAILKLLQEADRPLTAEDIFERVPQSSLATVYRALETFSDKGILNKHNINDSDKFYYTLAGEQHRHCAVCLDCHQMSYIETCPVHDMDTGDFTVTGHKLELYGYCAACEERHKHSKK
jgi:Fur family ferric uptake transcriptional regulator